MAFTENNFIEFAEIHKCRLKGLDFLSDCSVKFIEHFYRTIVHLPSIIIVAEFSEPEHRVTGFFLLTKNKDEFMRYFLKKNVFKIVMSPSAYIPIAKAVLNKFLFRNQARFDYQNEGVYLCTALWAPKGTGTRIMIRSEAEMKKARFDYFYVTVFERNLTAINFYRKFGFKVIAEYETFRGKKFLLSKGLSKC